MDFQMQVYTINIAKLQKKKKDVFARTVVTVIISNLDANETFKIVKLPKTKWTL